MNTRRDFLKRTGPLVLLPALATHLPSLDDPVLRIGVISDLHHGLAPDAMQRLSRFMQAMDEEKPDILFQLGDFHFGKPESKECQALWEQFEGPAYHVLGNHDMDFYTKAHMLDNWGMPAPYYAFDLAGYHFVILDRNNLKTPDGYVPYDTANFYVDSSMRAYADPEQLDWLRQDLQNTRLPTLVFSHQGLGYPVKNDYHAAARREIESILESTKDEAGLPKVAACFCGHHHLDRYAHKAGVHYVWLNSASYYWVGEKYGRMAFYEDSLFSVITLYQSGSIEIAGAHTTWRSPSPRALGFPDSDALTPYILNRVLR